MQVRNLAAEHANLLSAAGLPVRTPFRQIPGTAGSRADSQLPGLSDQREEAGARFDTHRGCGASLPLQSLSQKGLDFRGCHPGCRKNHKHCPSFSARRKFCSFSAAFGHEASRDPDHLLCRRPAHLRSGSSDADGYRQPADGHPCGAGQRAERPLRDALARSCWTILRDYWRAVRPTGLAFPRRSSRASRSPEMPWNACQKAHRLSGSQASYAAQPAARLRRSSARSRRPMSARFNCCSATAASRPRPAICGSPPARSAPRTSPLDLLPRPTARRAAARPAPAFLSGALHGPSEAGSGGRVPPLWRSLSRTAWRVAVAPRSGAS